MQHLTLLCKSVMFYSQHDEKFFFAWIDDIPAIVDTHAQYDELYLYVESHDISNRSLRELIALFHRYNIDMRQLQAFLTENNRKWFYDNPKAFWHEKVFQDEYTDTMN